MRDTIPVLRACTPREEQLQKNASTMKLKIELYRYGTLVFGKVLEMDEELRNKEGEPRKVLASDGWTKGFEIVSGTVPELYGESLYVRGRLREGMTLEELAGSFGASSPAPREGSPRLGTSSPSARRATNPKGACPWRSGATWWQGAAASTSRTACQGA